MMENEMKIHIKDFSEILKTEWANSWPYQTISLHTYEPQVVIYTPFMSWSGCTSDLKT